MEGSYGIQAGIVVDRHVASKAREFGMVPPKSVDSEEISVMLREWLPPNEFSRFNETIGGLKQLLGKGKKKLATEVEKKLRDKNIKKNKKLAFEVEKQLGYKNIVSRLLKK
jgi:endonuclease III